MLNSLLMGAAMLDDEGEVEDCSLDVIRQALELAKGLGVSVFDMFNQANNSGGPAWWLLGEEILQAAQPDDWEACAELCGADFLVHWGNFQPDNPNTRAHLARAHTTRDGILYGTHKTQDLEALAPWAASMPPSDMFCTSLSWSSYSEAAYLHKQQPHLSLEVLEEEAKWKHFRRILQYAAHGRAAVSREWGTK